MNLSLIHPASAALAADAADPRAAAIADVMADLIGRAAEVDPADPQVACRARLASGRAPALSRPMVEVRAGRIHAVVTAAAAGELARRLGRRAMRTQTIDQRQALHSAAAQVRIAVWDALALARPQREWWA